MLLSILSSTRALSGNSRALGSALILHALRAGASRTYRRRSRGSYYTEKYVMPLTPPTPLREMDVDRTHAQFNNISMEYERLQEESGILDAAIKRLEDECAAAQEELDKFSREAEERLAQKEERLAEAAKHRRKSVVKVEERAAASRDRKTKTALRKQKQMVEAELRRTRKKAAKLAEKVGKQLEKIEKRLAATRRKVNEQDKAVEERRKWMRMSRPRAPPRNPFSNYLHEQSEPPAIDVVQRWHELSMEEKEQYRNDPMVFPLHRKAMRAWYKSLTVAERRTHRQNVARKGSKGTIKPQSVFLREICPTLKPDPQTGRSSVFIQASKLWKELSAEEKARYAAIAKTESEARRAAILAAEAKGANSN
ncbi:hypothetical protein JR316_0011562 [Psilocybe cubensis]|uniref:Uncharacterized protein n=2 Tax=Psilocybe cubensis TaxID=181762 RepID=A0A8H7XTF5_PSICU|nr:hypothetical protein JR316_0011562 [Psilocybe cubensis]KAH9475995.1 hypothetical protein JR316_0011562 [Psilocybe cubensis]